MFLFLRFPWLSTAEQLSTPESAATCIAVDVVKWSSLHNRSVAPTMGPVEMCYCFPRSENASSSCELLGGNTIVGQSIVSQCRVQHHIAHIAATVIEEVSIENRNRKRHKRNGSCTPFYYHSESYYTNRQSVFFCSCFFYLEIQRSEKIASTGGEARESKWEEKGRNETY